MPRFVRPSWIEIEVEGRRSDIATGPRSRTGDLTAVLSVRENGSPVNALRIEVIPSQDGKTSRLTVLNYQDGSIIFERVITQ